MWCSQEAIDNTCGVLKKLLTLSITKTGFPNTAQKLQIAAKTNSIINIKLYKLLYNMFYIFLFKKKQYSK